MVRFHSVYLGKVSRLRREGRWAWEGERGKEGKGRGKRGGVGVNVWVLGEQEGMAE